MECYCSKMKTWLIGIFSVLCLCLNASETIENYSRPQKKVALMFLTISDLNHSEFWRNFLEGHSDKFTVYVHAKKPLKDPFFAQFHIPARASTSWAYTVSARKLLLCEAFKNPDNSKFVMLSESCIPLFDAETLYNKIIETDKSMVAWCNPWWKSN